MKDTYHYTFKTKRWWLNMNNKVLNYLHIGEDFHMWTIHMNQKCRWDRVAPYPYLGKW